MNQREIRQCKIHRRMNVLRNRYDRRILGSMTVLIAGLRYVWESCFKWHMYPEFLRLMTGMDLFSCGMEQMFM